MFSKKSNSIICFLLAVTVLIFAVVTTFQIPKVATAAVILYSDDGDNFFGEGNPVDTSEYIYWDNYVMHDEFMVSQAPSYKVTDTTISDYCAPATGTNIIGFNDRFYPNLIPNFEPGMMNGDEYWYFPDMRFEPVVQTFYSLYDYMQTNQNGAGTSGEQFKNGLKKFVNYHGYNLNYKSFYKNKTSIDLNALQDAIRNNKVGVLLCTRYNFVYAISHGKNETYLSKSDYFLAHMMMVYGCITVDYYKDGEIFRSDTYLQVSSGYATGIQGYVFVDNNAMEIQEALIVNIS